MSAPSAKTTSLDTRKHVVTRQRTHILERAQAQLSSSTCRITTKKDDGKRRISQTTEELSPSYASGSEDRSESSMEPAAAASDGESIYSTLEEQSERRTNEQPFEKLPSRAWYEFDWAVLVALVAPACQWLTGGDYIKNLVMLVLLVYYLHQIIEVPWQIYQRARVQRPLPRSLPATIEEKYQQIGASELRKIEVFFLCLAALSPFLGAAFLRYAAAATIGPESVSWFNVGLFVMATGMRPWAHLVERLRKRTGDLHEIIQYPIPPDIVTTRKLIDRLEELTRKIDKLEKFTRRNETQTMELREDVYHNIDEMSAKMDGIVRKQKKRQARQDSRVGGVEDTLRRMKSGQSQQESPVVFRLFPVSLLLHVVPSWLYLPPYRILIHSFYPSSIQRNGHALQSSGLRKDGYVGFLSRVGHVATLPLRIIVGMVLGQ